MIHVNLCKDILLAEFTVSWRYVLMVRRGLKCMNCALFDCESLDCVS